MSQVIEITRDNFAANLKKAVSVDRSLRGLIQRLIVFGFTEYADNQNSNWLSDIISADLKGVRTQAIQQYVQDHTDLVLTRMQDKSLRFKREAIEGYEFTMPEVTWYDYSNAGRVTIVDPIVLLNGLIKKLETAEDKTQEAKKLKEGTEEINHDLVAYLKAAPALNRAAA